MNYGHLFKPFFYGLPTEINEDNFRLLQPIIILSDKNKFSNLCKFSLDCFLNDNEQEFLCTAQKNDFKNYSKSLSVSTFFFFIKKNKFFLAIQSFGIKLSESLYTPKLRKSTQFNAINW